MKEAQQAISSMTKATSPQDLAAKQTDLMKTAFEKSVATMREMAEINKIEPKPPRRSTPGSPQHSRRSATTW